MPAFVAVQTMIESDKAFEGMKERRAYQGCNRLGSHFRPLQRTSASRLIEISRSLHRPTVGVSANGRADVQT